MNVTVEQLSEKAKTIFEKLKPLFPPGPPGHPSWREEGIIWEFGGRSYDLRTPEGRKALEERGKGQIGYQIYTQASSYAQKHAGSLENFEHEHIGRVNLHWLNILLVLDELSFQIETLDLME